MKKQLIGICGYANTGKDTIATHLITQGFEKRSFASPLKDAVSAIFGWDRELLEGITKESREFREKIDIFWSNELEADITPRHILQVVGSEVFRDNFYKDIWIAAFKKYYMSTTSSVVVADVRFENEAKAILSMGGRLVYVVRAGVTEPPYAHKSESEIKSIGEKYATDIISNYGTLEDFNTIIEFWYEGLKQ